MVELVWCLHSKREAVFDPENCMQTGWGGEPAHMQSLHKDRRLNDILDNMGFDASLVYMKT